MFPHPTGIVIGKNVVIGDNVKIYQHVTLGGKGRNDGYPILEDEVTIYSHAIVLGKVVIGKGSVVGAGSLVLDNVPENVVVVGSPARILRQNSIFEHKEFTSDQHIDEE